LALTSRSVSSYPAGSLVAAFSLSIHPPRAGFTGRQEDESRVIEDITLEMGRAETADRALGRQYRVRFRWITGARTCPSTSGSPVCVNQAAHASPLIQFLRRRLTDEDYSAMNRNAIVRHVPCTSGRMSVRGGSRVSAELDALTKAFRTFRRGPSAE
jgi:hypothetical protein